MKSNSKYIGLIFFCVAILSFALLFFGVKYLLGNPVTIQNIAAYIILSLIFGAISSTLYFLKLKIMSSVFALGLLVGFIEMYRAFLESRSGWEDLVGLLSLFTWMAIGLCAGTLLQIIFHFYCKLRARKKE